MMLNYEITGCWRGRFGSKKRKLAREKGLRESGVGGRNKSTMCVLSFVYIDLYISLLWIAGKGEN